MVIDRKETIEEGLPAGNGSEYTHRELEHMGKGEIRRRMIGEYVRYTIRVHNGGASLWVYYKPTGCDYESVYAIAL